ncbi:hypothetical protein Ait01nite_039550 [Actinoplanes italicus]|uniref:DUF1648 domain-containing protein n=1 Tax=Actinoplanes italicus TaxID=113567 RepID=A0A2T0JX15_9ACTN|nr:DUF1648 domain-containing protein [Actinoplanes italicus]PRX12020.1 hypothetical protein CLV67_13045 [Actinoplanes italicus]GIE30910.1 hypothetical protein Ait01nite_039550 [Actinoplanes italicus]
MTIDNGGRARWLPGVALTALPALLVPLIERAWVDRLPDPLPIHWNIAGHVDRTASVAGMTTTTLVIAGLAVLVALVVALVPALSWRVRRVVITVAAVHSAGAAGIWMMTAGMSLDAATAEDVTNPGWQVTALLLGAAAWGVVVALSCGRAPARSGVTDPPPAGLARLDLAPGQRAAWTEIAPIPRIAFWVLAALLGIAAVLAVAVNAWVAVPLVLVAGIVMVALQARFTVDGRGVTIGFGPWGWPRVRVPLREIVSAAPGSVQIAQWGGWGYRVSLDGHGRGLILRSSGPAVRLELSDDRYLLATVRDPETVAALVNSLLDTARTS